MRLVTYRRWHSHWTVRLCFNSSPFAGFLLSGEGNEGVTSLYGNWGLRLQNDDPFTLSLSLFKLRSVLIQKMPGVHEEKDEEMMKGWLQLTELSPPIPPHSRGGKVVVLWILELKLGFLAKTPSPEVSPPSPFLIISILASQSCMQPTKVFKRPRWGWEGSKVPPLVPGSRELKCRFPRHVVQNVPSYTKLLSIVWSSFTSSKYAD